MDEEEVQAIILKIESGEHVTPQEGAELLGDQLVTMAKAVADHEKRIKALESVWTQWHDEASI